VLISDQPNVITNGDESITGPVDDEIVEDMDDGQDDGPFTVNITSEYQYYCVLYSHSQLNSIYIYCSVLQALALVILALALLKLPATTSFIQSIHNLDSIMLVITSMF